MTSTNTSGDKAGRGGWGFRSPAAFPLLGRLPAERRYPVLLAFFLLTALLTLASAALHTWQAGRQASHLDVATHLQMLTQRNANSAQQAVSGNQPAFARLREGRDAFAADLAGLIGGGAGVSAAPDWAQAELSALRQRWETSHREIDLLLSREADLLGMGQAIELPQFPEVGRAVGTVVAESEALLGMTRSLGERFAAESAWPTLAMTFLFACLSLAGLLFLGLYVVAEARSRAEDAAQENRRNQEAILRLLNEMGDLADGDLSVRATVTEDITGAIADSVNFAVEELRTLVANIHRATGQVTQATEEARQVSDQLLIAAEHQSRQVAEASTAIDRMSDANADVSRNAALSAQVAVQSLQAARNGGDSVRNAIAAMNALRDQIQGTSKRIKRLGESSQEIGEIVELITDITEQTNVLALNAAIQATAAGEAGRGFTVVAEEVQSLAERSAQATRRIGAIVKTIQSDTQDAVHAMEVSTRGVVEGTSLSDAAGLALQEIETVSDRLAQLIRNISDATQDQAQTAEHIAGHMRRILEIVQQSSTGTQRSARTIGELSALAEELKVSVAGFKL